MTTDPPLHSRILLLLALALLSSCSTSQAFLERSVTVGDQRYRYRVWLPPRYTRLRRWPVILFLHGSGERGDDNSSQLNAGLAPALGEYGDRYKCIVVLPQCLPDREWYGEMEAQALAALEATIREFHGDPGRVYVTGVSMGGTGAWYMARHRRRFAAVVPICGEVARSPDDPFPIELPPDIARIVGAPDPYAALAAAVGRVPVWVFHGADDDVVPVSESRNMVAALRRAGGNVRYTEYAGVGHDAWDLAYADASLIQWLLEQRLPRRATADTEGSRE